MRKFIFSLLFLQSLLLFSQTEPANPNPWLIPDKTWSGGETYTRTDPNKPVLWVRADSTELSAKYWRDVSGNGRHLFPYTGTLPDTFARMNFNRSFFLENGNHFMLPDFPLRGRRVTVMMVYQIEDTLSENSLWSLQMDTNVRIGLTTQNIMCENVGVQYADSNRLTPVVNTLRQTWQEEYGTGDFLLGKCDSFPFQGRIAECLVFNGKLNNTLFTQYISYLSVKYGITLFKTDYVNSAGTVIWDYRNNPTYSYSIAGIGKDLTMGLEQKQSYMLDEKIIIGLSSLAATNEENRAALYEGDFLIWGFDLTLLDRHGSVYLEDGFELEVYGNGLLQATGTGASHYSTFMQVDGSQWAEQGDVNDYYLLIDRSGTGNFLSTQVEFYMPDFVDTNNIMYFSDIYWDTDNNGKDRFCFAKIPFDSLFESRSMTVNNSNAGNQTGKTGNKTQNKQANQSDAKQKQIVEQKQAQAMAKNNYNLYPNPNTGKFTIEVHYKEVSDIMIRVYTPDGKLMNAWSAQNQNSYRYEGETSVRGQYMIDIEGGGERKSLKMIVQ